MSNERLENLFNLPNHDSSNELDDIKKALADVDDNIDDDSNNNDDSIESLKSDTMQALDMIQEREQRIKQLVDLKEYDEGVDTLYKESLEAFRDAFSIAKDLPGRDASEMMSAASAFAKIALDSKNSKLKSRLDVISLSLKKQQIDQKEVKKEEETISGESKFLDRNQILQSLSDMMKSQGNEVPTK